jgi:hypothetical protein
MAFVGIWHCSHLFKYLGEESLLTSDDVLITHLPTQEACIEHDDEPNTFRVPRRELTPSIWTMWRSIRIYDELWKRNVDIPVDQFDSKLLCTAEFMAEVFETESKRDCDPQFHKFNLPYLANLIAQKPRISSLVKDENLRGQTEAAVDRAIAAQRIVVSYSEPTRFNRARMCIPGPIRRHKALFFGLCATAGIALYAFKEPEAARALLSQAAALKDTLYAQMNVLQGALYAL